MYSIYLLLVAFALGQLSTAQYQLRHGAMPLLENPFGRMLARQAETCVEATDTLCPGGDGCCPSGAPCATQANGVGYCEENCAGGPTCTGIMSGLCCPIGEECDYVSTVCAPAVTTALDTSFSVPPVVATTTGLPAESTSSFSATSYVGASVGATATTAFSIGSPTTAVFSIGSPTTTAFSIESATTAYSIESTSVSPQTTAVATLYTPTVETFSSNEETTAGISTFSESASSGGAATTTNAAGSDASHIEVSTTLATLLGWLSLFLF